MIIWCQLNFILGNCKIGVHWDVKYAEVMFLEMLSNMKMFLLIVCHCSEAEYFNLFLLY